MRVKPQAPIASLERAGSELFIATSQFIRIMGNLAFVLDILCRFLKSIVFMLNSRETLPKLVVRVTLLIEKSQIG